MLSFGFLAFVFFEMSGGVDFDAQTLRDSRVEARTGGLPALEPVVRTAEVTPTEEESVTRVSLSLTSVNDVLRPTNLRTQPARIVAEPEPEVTDAVSEAEPTIILPSLIVDRSTAITPVKFDDGGETEQPIVAPASGFAVRAVTGSRVNVRGGPGTSYAVVNNMVRGDKVEILQETGDGWVRLRPVGGGPEGWMAAFLLSDN
ncbi:MAG: SH3 domain-containing protein [Pseudomonadota bacterium]